MIRALPLLALSAALVACGSAEPEPAPTPTMTADTGPKTLVAANLSDIPLGPKIEGPQGPEPQSEIMADDGTMLGTITSYVACPAPTTEDGDPIPPTFNSVCDPKAQPEGTVYTFVHRIALSEGLASEMGEPGAPGTYVFRMLRPAHGFNNVVGFDAAQAQAALGEAGEIKVQVEDDSLVWRVVAGDGWTAGETLTLFWQATLPPAGPADAYQLRIGDHTAGVTAPFPGEPEKPASEAAAN
ncbi:hypothetical protein [Paraurantiacibacter namhicola]|uniref:Lipoprotein n=1 Tax=Paraurantiacibacter namhicola TaxID=645517 RepID=A0A1C7D983_9SPHN|nr:hypothetical protein [Paraurantiacibacter namhicola]ANU07922.1 hypothetical protein A6F65_01623 [Paraurantiacibacter namhicola]